MGTGAESRARTLAGTDAIARWASVRESKILPNTR